MQDIETNPRLKPTVARVKWLEGSYRDNLQGAGDIEWSNKLYEGSKVLSSGNKTHLCQKPNGQKYIYDESSNDIKRLSLFDRLKRMFKR